MKTRFEDLAPFTRGVQRSYRWREFLRMLPFVGFFSILLTLCSWPFLPQYSRVIGLFSFILGISGGLWIRWSHRLSFQEIMALTDRKLRLDARLLSIIQMNDSPVSTPTSRPSTQTLLADIRLPLARTVLPPSSLATITLSWLSLSGLGLCALLCTPPELPGWREHSLSLQARHQSASQIQRSLQELPSSPIRAQTESLIRQLRNPEVPIQSILKQSALLATRIQKDLSQTPPPRSPHKPISSPSVGKNSGPNTHSPEATKSGSGSSNTTHNPSRSSSTSQSGSPPKQGQSPPSRAQNTLALQKLEARLLASNSRLRDRPHLPALSKPRPHASSPDASQIVRKDPFSSDTGSGAPGRGSIPSIPKIPTSSAQVKFRVHSTGRDTINGFLTHEESRIARQYLTLHRRRGSNHR